MKVDECLQNLAETDEDCARAKALMKGLELKLKRVKFGIQLSMEGKSVAEKEAKAYASPEYAEACEAYQDAVADYEILANKRNSWSMGFEYWRSNNANRRQAGGNL